MDSGTGFICTFVRLMNHSDLDGSHKPFQIGVV